MTMILIKTGYLEYLTRRCFSYLFCFHQNDIEKIADVTYGYQVLTDGNELLNFIFILIGVLKQNIRKNKYKLNIFYYKINFKLNKNL
jgi:hypothetical protein